jgi:hypothetical protein
MPKKGKHKHHQDEDGAMLTSESDAKGREEGKSQELAAGLNGYSAPRESMSRKEYEKALKPLQVELVKLQTWVKQSQPPRLPRRRSPRTHRARKDADVFSALHATLSGGWRDRALR